MALDIKSFILTKIYQKTAQTFQHVLIISLQVGEEILMSESPKKPPLILGGGGLNFQFVMRRP
jgi:hypothetical protein